MRIDTFFVCTHTPSPLGREGENFLFSVNQFPTSLALSDFSLDNLFHCLNNGIKNKKLHH